MQLTGGLVFLLVYVLLSRRPSARLPLDRPAAALLGACATVGLGVLSPHRALAAIDANTLLLLFGMMGMGAFLAADGFFEQMERRLIESARTPRRLLGYIVWGSGLASALVTNDAVCVLAAPVVARLVARQAGRLPALPFFLALASGANTGSVATLVGNPQNMLCGMLGGIGYRQYLVLAGPLAVACLALNHAFLRWCFRRELGAAGSTLTSPEGPEHLSTRTRLTLAVFALSVVLFMVGAPLSWTAVGAFACLIFLQRRTLLDIWPRVDWPLLVFFSGLFVVVAGFQASGIPSRLFAAFPLVTHDSGSLGFFDHLRLSAIFLVGSNIVSNVPFILLVEPAMAHLPNPQWGWELLAMVSTFAGNMTLLGSVANLIVAEAAAPLGGMGFFPYLRVGAPLSVACALLATLWMTLVPMLH